MCASLVAAKSGTGLAITSPLILYRSLVASRRIAPDPAQHRLAIKLQALNERLENYEAVKGQWEGLISELRAESKHWDPASNHQYVPQWRGVKEMRRTWRRLFLGETETTSQRQESERELVRYLSSAQEAMQVEAPQGLLVHGRVGSGKSMLVDMLLLDGASKWAAKGARWHYGEFMLHVVQNLSKLPTQVDQSQTETKDDASVSLKESHSILSLAISLIRRSPLLVIDEFQLPDRMASKTLAHLLTIFFRLGGVFVATSNRLPDELAKAAGRQYGLAADEFAEFVDLLKAKCEIWDMDGFKDYRRVKMEKDEDGNVCAIDEDDSLGYYLTVDSHDDVSKAEQKLTELLHDNQLGSSQETTIDWSQTSLQVFGRNLIVPKSFQDTACWTFDELCAARLGPADYISIGARFKTIIIHEVPVLNSSLKNEARRLISAIDAFYEAGCRLFVTAKAVPDQLFFPEEDLAARSDDAMHAETFAEMHQDATVPFRPNISSYEPNIRQQLRPDDAMEDDPPGRARSSVLSHLSSQEQIQLVDNLLDFKHISSFVGEDEMFAYRRAVSRIWEMCSPKWWANTRWKPGSSRHWETNPPDSTASNPSLAKGTELENSVIAPRFKAQDHAWNMVERPGRTNVR
jgi:protein AFG1